MDPSQALASDTWSIVSSSFEWSLGPLLLAASWLALVSNAVYLSVDQESIYEGACWSLIPEELTSWSPVMGLLGLTHGERLSLPTNGCKLGGLVFEEGLVRPSLPSRGDLLADLRECRKIPPVAFEGPGMSFSPV